MNVTLASGLNINKFFATFIFHRAYLSGDSNWKLKDGNNNSSTEQQMTRIADLEID